MPLDAGRGPRSHADRKNVRQLDDQALEIRRKIPADLD
jgi:hypothetical protein